MRGSHLLIVVALYCASANAQPWKSALNQRSPVPPVARGDWLLNPESFRARVYRGERADTLVLDNGLVQRTFLLAPNAACISLRQRTTGAELLRAVRPECELTIDGRIQPIGGLVGQPVGNYLLPEWLDQLQPDAAAWTFIGFESHPLPARFEWKRHAEWMASKPAWPPPGIELVLHFAAPARSGMLADCDVFYELYDGLPLVGKRFALHNRGPRPLRLDTFAAETLAFVESESSVDVNPRPPLPPVHVETDFPTVAMQGEVAQRQTVRWLTDPTFTTQVSYKLDTPCVLECRPPLGPARTLKPGDCFESFRTWLLAFDGTDADRRTLSLARMYRTIAPWVAENPLIFHVRSAAPDAVRAGLDQMADAGFELMILTFGSGFDIEKRDPDYRAQLKELADYAHARGLALGGYSLLASRSVSAADDVINPATSQPGGFAIFDNSPCLGSRWADGYFAALTSFFEETGCDVLEHDGSYPGDACASTTHPGHNGYDDSRWNQWERITAFYRWCRGRGIYLNVPDWYYLSGSNKNGMGYRETNWSLPRAQQELIERQNIADGTRYKSPTMGWMFVPLTEYHGGGAAATIEPLREHLDHYERRLQNLLGAGVQACYRGPRLYDAPETRDMLKRWVGWYKQHRAILDSDLLVLRRADGRDWDGWLHVNPATPERALAALYNPLPIPITRTVRLPLYYTGLDTAARVSINGETAKEYTLARDYSIEAEVTLPPQGFAWVVVTAGGP